MRAAARGWLAVSVAVAITASVAIGGAAHAANDAPKGKVAYDKNADLTFAYSAGPPGLDPVRPGHLYTFMAPIYDRLTQINDNLEVEPMLAESWEFAKDGSTLEFKLRTDATFADGTKIDAAAVKANLDRARTAPYSTQLNALKSITNVTAVNPTTVRLTLAPGQGVQLPSVLALNAGMIVNPKAIADPNADLTQGPGAGNESGPYKLESATLGLAAGQAQYVQRDDWANYWDKTAGRIKRLKVIGIAHRRPAHQRGAGGRHQRGPGHGCGRAASQAARRLQRARGHALHAGDHAAGALHEGQPARAREPEAPAGDPGRARQGGVVRRPVLRVLRAEQPGLPGAALGARRRARQEDAVQPGEGQEAAGGVGRRPTRRSRSCTCRSTSRKQRSRRTSWGRSGSTSSSIPAPTQAGGPSFANGDFDMCWSQLISIDPGDTMANTYLNNTPPVMPLIPAADQAEFLPLQEKLTDPASTQEQREKVWRQIATKLDENAYIVPVCNASQVWVHDGSIGNIDDILGEWSGLVDFRYLYKTKS